MRIRRPPVRPCRRRRRARRVEPAVPSGNRCCALGRADLRQLRGAGLPVQREQRGRAEPRGERQDRRHDVPGLREHLQGHRRTLPASRPGRTSRRSTSFFNIDPILATDRVTGRTFAGGLAGECSRPEPTATTTVAAGPRWATPAPACSTTRASAQVRGRARRRWAATYNRAVYYCAQNGNDACATSDQRRTHLRRAGRWSAAPAAASTGTSR